LPERNDAILRPLIPFSTNEYVLYVGERKSAYKNFRLSVQACARVKRPLVFVGGGAVTMEERAFLDAQLGPNRHTHLLGLDNQTLNILYNHAFCFLYPSLYEGFGIPILEAQRAGCPVVSTNRSSIPEVAGEGAFLVDDVSVAGVSGMLEHIAGADTETRRKVQMGAANAHRFSWDKCYLETKHVYEQLLRS
jgi:mannosyltransferase